ncbi:MAG: S-layer homology domain-containing protein [Acutalibacter sp.]|jgi:hypothetical protein
MEKTRQRPWKRLLAALLAVALIWCAAPPLVRQVQAASWMDSYLNKVVDWGVMRGDLQGNLEPNRDITRAEFCTMINRAFGYTEVGPHPFKDVKSTDWYADDIAIAYNQGYLAGTSATTASPNDPLTREQAMVILGKNLMLQTQPGEVLGFTDSRTFSDWSKGWIRAVAECGIVSGYPDGTFRPQNNISRGETATILVKAIGNLVKQSGETSLGSVYGNVVINTSGVHLKDTVIAGNLYITGGVGLGDVLLDNVTVLGRIVVSGAGESNAGESSVILRNVSAQEMIVDGLSNQFVSIRAEGDTTVDVTHVRTDSYLEDATESPYGLLSIEMDGEDGLSVQVAGNIKDVINKTPDSHLTIAQGPADTVTIDEEATNSTLTIENGASVGNLNLDVGTTVDGKGDIEHANVNAPGSTIEQLPDTIVIRPGITADVNGSTMDSTAASESSADPRLLAGYPAAENVAPTSASGVFAANKASTIYWALSATTDGSVDEDDLIDPPAYGGGIIKNGSIQVGSSGEEGTAKLTGLTSDGAYYISAVAVDNRGQRSPVKVTAFSTPDNTVPRFTSGYPYMSKITNVAGQVAVMANKSCQLYYAVFPKGSEAPTVQDFKTGSLSGNLGSGIRDVTKNVIDLFYVNGQNLQEQVEYDLYLCLVDADGGLNSNVQKLTFKTVDGTPPVFVTEPTVTSVQVTSVGLQAMLNENGTIYWAVVAQGDDYPDPIMGATERPALDELAAKVAVATGAGALKYGSVKATGNRNVTLNITGLDRETGYDLYYVAQDTAGNYSQTVRKITIHTLDNTPPSVEQQFTKTADEEGTEPMADTDIELVFSEGIQDADNFKSTFFELYQKEDTETLTKLLKQDITLMVKSGSQWVVVPDKQANTDQLQWVDYSKVKVDMEDGRTIVKFEYDSAVKLTSGGTYQFVLNNITDTSDNRNEMKPANYKLPQFTTAFAQVDLSSVAIPTPPQNGQDPVRVDMAFEMRPLSTGAVAKGIDYDVFLWSNISVNFDVYVRVVDPNGNVITDSPSTENNITDPMADIMNTGKRDTNGWKKLNTSEEYSILASDEWQYASVRGKTNANEKYPWLGDLEEGYAYQYAIHLTKVGESSDYNTWSENVQLYVTVPAGVSTALSSTANGSGEKTWNTSIADGSISPVGNPKEFYVSRQFTDQTPPTFSLGYPTFTPSDSYVNMNVMLNRDGTLYYVVAPIDSNGNCTVSTAFEKEPSPGAGTDVPNEGEFSPPEKGDQKGITQIEEHQLSTPTNTAVFNGNFTGNAQVKVGRTTAGSTLKQIKVDGLLADTQYFVFMVLKGESQNLSQVYYFQFHTTKVATPQIQLSVNGNEVTVTPDVTSKVDYIVIPTTYNNEYSFLKKSFWNYFDSTRYGAAWSNEVKNKLFPQGPSDPTVLDALLTTVSGMNGQTVFDAAANTEAYDQLLAMVVNKTVGSTTDQGTVQQVEANVGQKVTCKLDALGQYYFIAAARHVQGQEYAFHAVAGVQMADKTPPTYVSAVTNLNPLAKKLQSDTLVGPTVWQEAPQNFLYSGTLSLVFDEPIYMYNSNNGSRTPLNNDNIQGLLGGTSITSAKIDTDSGGSTIEISFEKAGHSSSIVVFKNGYICDEAGNNLGKAITLQLNTTARGTDGNYWPKWESNPPAENG